MFTTYKKHNNELYNNINWTNDLETDELKIFSPRERGVEYSVEDGGDRFFIHTNLKNKNFSLMETPYQETNKDSWQDHITPGDKIFLDDVAIFDKFIALRESHEGLLKIKIIDRKTDESFFLKTKL